MKPFVKKTMWQISVSEAATETSSGLMAASAAAVVDDAPTAVVSAEEVGRSQGAGVTPL